MKIIIPFLIAILFTACGPSIEARVQGTLTAIPTSTAIIRTQIVQKVITQVRIVERVEYRDKIVTATPTGPTSTPAPTVDVTKTDKRPGSYLVGSEIASGNWRSTGTGSDCYWEVRNRSGEIMNNNYGDAGGVMFIQAGAFVVALDSECGTWEFIE